MTGRLSLAQTRWPLVAEGDRPLVLLPVGAVEQHGPHLPMGTDTIIASAVCHTVAGRLDAGGLPVLVAPALAYGASGEHEGFPGTISIGHDALRDVLVEIGRSACAWAEGLILVNGHGGNTGTVRDAVLKLRGEGRAVAWTGCGLPGADAHAGRTETSLLLHLAPWAVRTDLAEPGAVEPVATLLPRLRRDGVRSVSANGVLGDPAGASADEGRELFARVAGRVAGELADVDVDDQGRLRPAGARIG